MQDKHGKQMYQWAKDLFPICRSLTGEGVRQTLRYIQALIPNLEIKSIPSGEQVFDWTIPDEWNIDDAWISDLSGNRLISFKDNNLHVMGYSDQVEKELTYEELDKHLYSLPDQPDAIPYITSYYKKRWGFCVSENQRKELKKHRKLKVKVEATLHNGELNYGELLIQGKSKKEILLSTYVCHPSMANNELSGPVVTTALAQYIQTLDRYYSYRIIFIPETIGSIAYLSKHLIEMKKNTIAGFVITCVGDDRTYSYIPSRMGNTLADKVALHALKYEYPDFDRYSFLDRGSDERQYCAPGIDLPVCSICRSKYGEYPEYHTSLDNLDLISPSGLNGSFSLYRKIIDLLENNKTYQVTTKCEPQLGKRGLYPTISTKKSGEQTRTMTNLIAYCDGKNDLLDIAEIIQEDGVNLIQLTQTLEKSGVLENSSQPNF